MLKLDLDPSYFEEIKLILQRIAPTAEIWAYGSRLSDKHHEGSDLDLVLRHPNQLNQVSPEVFLLREAFQDSNIPILIDIMDWATLPTRFRQEIEKKYVVIQS